MIKLFALLPFVMTGVLAGVEPTNIFIEYGALGICAFSVAMLFRQLTAVRESHSLERESLVTALRTQNEVHQQERDKLMGTLFRLNEHLTGIIEKGIQADERLTAALRNVKCLISEEHR
jgi:hypothetical protein